MSYPSSPLRSPVLSGRGSSVVDLETVQVVDLFSGCGGLSHGFASISTTRVQYVLKGALDMDKHANATYRRMLGVAPVLGDIREFATAEGADRLRAAWHLTKDPLLLVGGPPCQGFSSHRKKDPRFDARNELLDAFGRVAVHLRPEVVVMENVPEMLRDQHWPHFERWLAVMEAAGYDVRTRIHNLAEFGVPQERFRVLAIARRDGVQVTMPPKSHDPNTFVTVRDAIGHLPPIDSGGWGTSDPMHITSRHRASTVDLIRMIPLDGGSRRSLPPGVGPECWNGVDGFRDVYGRLAWDKPSVAITARCRTPSCGRFVHPEQHRGLSVREAALLQGFPETFQFEGPFDDKFKQIGNAVAPIFSAAVAAHLDRTWRSHDLSPAGEEGFINGPLGKSFASSIAGIKRRGGRSELVTAAP